MDSTHLVVLVTTPTIEAGQEIAHKLVTDKLAACVNILPGMTSIYTWDGEVCDDSEVLLIIKTSADLFEDLSAIVQGLHPYDVPEVIALPITTGSEKYLNWINAVTRSA